MRGKFETEIAELTRELDTMRDKWSKSRDEAAKKEEELIVVKALLKTKEVALQQAQEVNLLSSVLSTSICVIISTHWYKKATIFLSRLISVNIKK